jgi:hypothetical protein
LAEAPEAELPPIRLPAKGILSELGTHTAITAMTLRDKSLKCLLMALLLTTFPAVGHFHPLVPLAEAALRRGDDVVIASGVNLADWVQSCGFEFAPVGMALPRFRYFFGDRHHKGSAQRGRYMDWARRLAYVTGTVDQELLARKEYLAAENRILKGQLKGRLMLANAERATLGEIGHRLGSQASCAGRNRRPAQTAQREHFCGEEVGSRQQRQVGSNEDRPRGRALALRRGWQAVPSQNIANL